MPGNEMLNRPFVHLWATSAASCFIMGWTVEAAAVDAPTIYDNYQMFPVGSRAAGMAGAYTALACDEASLHYNPAALGCARASRLELAANAYLLEAMSVPDAFGQGNDISAVNFHSIPSIAGAVRIIADGEEDGSGRVALGFNVVLPHSLMLTIDPVQPEEPSFLATKVFDNLTSLEIGAGWQINSTVAIGLSLGGALRVFASQMDLLARATTPIPCAGGTCSEFYQTTQDQEAMALGLRARAGARFTPTDDLSMGLAITTPSLDVWGSSKLFTTVNFLADTGQGLAASAIPLRFKGTSELSMPLRLAAGIAYTTGPLTLALDGSINSPHIVETLKDLEQTVIQGDVPLTDAQVASFELAHDRTWQPNINVGAEIAVTDDVVINGGFFTDLSSVSAKAIEDLQSDRVHMFGGTLALGLLGHRARGWFGASFEMGVADTSVFAGQSLDFDSLLGGGFDADATSTITRWTAAGFIGSNYSFFTGDQENEDPESK